MSASAIEWTERTWNPVVGCSVHSAGCKHCYAMTMAGRLEAMFRAGQGAMAHYAGTTQASKAGSVWTGEVNVAPDAIFLAPLKRKKPTTWFVNSMSDLFHESVPDDVIDRVFAVMALCPQHRFQVLTKRADRMRAYSNDPRTPGRIARAILDMRIAGTVAHRDPWPVQTVGDVDNPEDVTVAWPLANVWLGVSVEDQRAADARIPYLLATPAAVRFLSCEPLLGPVDLNCIDINGDAEMDAIAPRAWQDEIAQWQGSSARWEADFEDWFGKHPDQVSGNMHPTIDWIIVGGESGPGARPMHPDWARGLRDQCAAAGVPFFFKQWGEWAPDHGPEKVEGHKIVTDRVMEGRVQCAVLVDGTWQHFPDAYAVPIELCARHLEVYRYGKKAAGRLLDGVQHGGMPA